MKPQPYAKLVGKMRELGITQDELAAKIGIHAVTLNRKLRGKFQFRQGEIERILTVIGEPLENAELYFFKA